MGMTRRFVLAALLAVGGLTGAAVIDSPLLGVGTAAAADKFYVEYTKYMVKKGVATKLLSGRDGPYDTRRQAQNRADKYNSDDTTVNGVRYYYIARVRP